MAKMMLSAFADEYADSLTEQLQALNRFGIEYLELRAADGKNVSNMSYSDVTDIIEKLNAYGEKVTFLGDGVPVYKDKLEAGLTVEYHFAPAHVNRQSAAAVGALGIQYFAQGKVESARDHQPEYLRLSQAEREREEKNAGML